MERNGTLDYARFIAAIGIIVFHVGAPGGSIGYAALPFFLIMLVYLAFPSAEKQGFSDYAKTRFIRLLLPWIVWSIVYGALKLTEVLLTGRPLSSEFAPWMLLTGPALHLWFLPFAFAACIAIWPLAHLSTGAGRRWLLAFSAAGLFLAAKIVEFGSDLTTSQPFAQWLYALPAVLVGSIFALINKCKQLSWEVAVATGGLIFLLSLLGWPSGSLQLVIASGALLLCLAIPLPSTVASRRFGDLALTVYLAHPIVISILLRLTPLAAESVTMTIAAVGCTILLASTLRRLRLPVISRAL